MAIVLHWNELLFQNFTGHFPENHVQIMLETGVQHSNDLSKMMSTGPRATTCWFEQIIACPLGYFFGFRIFFVTSDVILCKSDLGSLFGAARSSRYISF